MAQVSRVDEYINCTLYGTKADTARGTLRSLQDPATDGVRNIPPDFRVQVASDNRRGSSQGRAARNLRRAKEDRYSIAFAASFSGTARFGLPRVSRDLYQTPDSPRPGCALDVKGSTVDVKASTMYVKGSTVDVKGSTLDVKGSTVYVKGSTVDVMGVTSSPS
eukprot:4593657-Pyramimonas_sp.AAC.1